MATERRLSGTLCLTYFKLPPMTCPTHENSRLLRHRYLILAGCLAVWLCAATRSAAESGAAPLTEAPVPADQDPAEPDPSITLRGSVWRTKAGIVFLRTPVGLLTLSSKTTLKDLKGSHEVFFWVHERNLVVEIRKRSDGSLVHRYLSGPMTPGPDDSKTLRWWTVDGEQTVHVGTQEEKLSSRREGDQLTVEVDESQTVVGIHDLQFDLQISQLPPSGSEGHVRLSGTVSKLKSNFVFFRTPVGVVMVNAKIGVPRVKVGQPMTLQIDNGHVAVDLAKAAKPAPRSSALPVAPTTSPF